MGQKATAESLFGGDVTLGSFQEMMEEEARLLGRLGALCPDVSPNQLDYWGVGPPYGDDAPADNYPMAWGVLGYDSIEEHEEAVMDMDDCSYAADGFRLCLFGFLTPLLEQQESPVNRAAA